MLLTQKINFDYHYKLRKWRSKLWDQKAIEWRENNKTSKNISISNKNIWILFP